MKVLIFGATGMVGQGVLRECLAEPAIDRIHVVARKSAGQAGAKLKETIQSDVSALSSLEDEIGDCDACFYCLGVSAAGRSEEEYRRLTCDFTLSIATALSRLNPRMTFVY